MDHGNVKRWCKGRWEGWDDPLLGTKIAPLALDYESAGKRLGTRQNTYTAMDLASLALVFEKERLEKGNSTPAVKGVWGKSTHFLREKPWGRGWRVPTLRVPAPNSWKQQCNSKAQFWGQDIQTLDQAGLSMDFYFIWTSQSQRAHVKLRLCKIYLNLTLREHFSVAF